MYIRSYLYVASYMVLVATTVHLFLSTNIIRYYVHFII